MMQAQNAGTYFSGCARCMGHGHFVVSSFGAQPEVFSQMEAQQELCLLVMSDRVSMDHVDALAKQVVNSGLPKYRPPDVVERIRQFFETESWTARFSKSEDGGPRRIFVSTSDIAAAVHEFLLTSRGQHLH